MKREIMKRNNIQYSFRRLSVILAILFILQALPITFAAQQPTITATKSASPTDIYVAGSGGSPEWTTITITVTGYGGTATQTGLPIDVVFAIDSSGSMSWNDPSDLRKTAAKSFTDLLLDDHQAGVVSWDDTIDFTLQLTTTDTSGKTTVKNSIDSVDSSGGTNLNVGLNAAISVLDANTRIGSSVEVIIFLTDGEGTYTSYSSGGPASIAASKGYKIYSIGLGSISSTPLIDMAINTGGNYYSSATAANLQAIFDDIFQAVVISTAPTDVDLVEVTQGYIIDESSFSVPYDWTDGITTYKWEDIGEKTGVGDEADPLTAAETFTVSFNAKCDETGSNKPVDVDGSAVVNFIDPSGSPASVNLPQAYINVNAPAPTQAPTIETCNIGGGLVDVFFPSDPIYVKGSGYTPGKHDLWVVPDIDWDDPAPIKIPARIPNTATEVIADSAGIVNAYENLAWDTPPTHSVGSFDIVVDVNKNGYYDKDIDALDDMDITYAGTNGFFVIPELPIGTLMGLASCLAALGIMLKSKKVLHR